MDATLRCHCGGDIKLVTEVTVVSTILVTGFDGSLHYRGNFKQYNKRSFHYVCVSCGSWRGDLEDGEIYLPWLYDRKSKRHFFPALPPLTGLCWVCGKIKQSLYSSEYVCKTCFMRRFKSSKILSTSDKIWCRHCSGDMAVIGTHGNELQTECISCGRADWIEEIIPELEVWR